MHAAAAGIAVVPGIEITSVWHGMDVHVLGYFVDIDSAALASYLERQRTDRVERVRRMADRLAALGSPIDADALLRDWPASGPLAIGRPHLARALVEAGHATDVGDAFDRFQRSGAPAYVPRHSPSPFDAVRVIAQAGGIASLAHPGSLGHDELIPELVRGGLDALEAWHPDHSPTEVERYRGMAREHGLALTGGSDFPGERSHGASALGAVLLPAEEFAALTARHGAGAHHDTRNRT